MTLAGMLSYRGVGGNKIYFPTPEKRREGKDQGEKRGRRAEEIKTLQNCGPLGFLWHFLCLQSHTVTHRHTVKTSSLHINVIMGPLKVDGILSSSVSFS